MIILVIISGSGSFKKALPLLQAGLGGRTHLEKKRPIPLPVLS